MPKTFQPKKLLNIDCVCKQNRNSCEFSMEAAAVNELLSYR